jgi:WD40 repeat protein
MDRLTGARLLTTGDGYVEVAHEALLREWPRLQTWLNEDAAGRQVHLHLIGAARDWEARGREPGDLYRGARLAAALDWAPAHEDELNALEREFVDESRLASDRDAERQRRTNRSLRLLLAGTGVFLIVAVGAGLFAAYQAQIAAQAGEFARSRELAASAIAMLDDDPTLSKLLALSAASIADPPVESLAALHRAWDADRVIYRYEWPTNREVGQLYTDLDPTGRYLVATGFYIDTPHDYLEVVDRATGEILWSVDPADESVGIGYGYFTPDGERVVYGAYRENSPPEQPGAGPSELGVHVRDALTGAEISHWDAGSCGAAVLAVSKVNVLVKRTEPPDDAPAPPATESPSTAPPTTAPPAKCSEIRSAANPHILELELIDLESGERTLLSSDVPGTDEAGLSLDGRIVAFDEYEDSTSYEIVSVLLDLNTNTRVPIELTGGAVRDLSGDGSLVLYGDDPLELWDWRERESVAQLPGHKGLTAYAEFSPDGGTIFSTGADATLRGQDIATRDETISFPGIANGRPAISDAGLVLVPLFGTRTAGLVDTGLRGELAAIAARELSAAPGPGDDCSVFGDLDVGGNFAAFDNYCGPSSATASSTTSIIDISRLELRQSLADGYGMALSPDGTRVARFKSEVRNASLWTGAAEIVDSSTGQQIVEMEGLCRYNLSSVGGAYPPPENENCEEFPNPPFPILGWQLRWSPDGQMVAIVDGIEGYFVVWNAQDGQVIPGSLDANRRQRLPAFDVSFTPDSRQLLVSYTSGSATGVLESVSTTTWNTEQTRDLDETRVRLAFIGYSADASTVIGITGFRGFGGGALRWIDVRTLEDLRESRPRVHDGPPLAFAVAADRSLLATASSDGFVRVWDSSTSRLEHEISFPGSAVNGVAFLGDSRLGVVLDDGNLRVLTIDPKELLAMARLSLTRGYSQAECDRFNLEPCPTLEEMRGD